MITINPVKFNNVTPVAFGEGNLNNITPNVGILSLQTPNAKINFENDLNRSQRADLVQNGNFLKAFAAKLQRTYDILFSKNYNANPQAYNRFDYLV